MHARTVKCLTKNDSTCSHYDRFSPRFRASLEICCLVSRLIRSTRVFLARGIILSTVGIKLVDEQVRKNNLAEFVLFYFLFCKFVAINSSFENVV